MLNCQEHLLLITLSSRKQEFKNNFLFKEEVGIATKARKQRASYHLYQPKLLLHKGPT